MHYKIESFLNLNINIIKAFIIFFYLIGAIGLVIPETNSIFIQLIPFALLFSVCILSLYHKTNSIYKSILLFLLIAIIGYITEVVGVSTHLIFGNYSYGTGLGIKLFNTPLLIGINWALLVYFTACIFQKVKINNGLKLLGASLLMLFYDIILEQVAPNIDMWSWYNNRIPLQNYIAWFILAFLFQLLVYKFKLLYNNKIAATLFICHLSFFIFIFILNTLIK